MNIKSPTWIDISVPIAPDRTPRWPGSPEISLVPRLSHGVDGVQDTTLQMSLHTGTHIDAPLHFVEGGKTLESIPLSRLMGPCYILDLRGVDVITPALLAQHVPQSPCERLLLKTDNERRWSPEFDASFTGLSLAAARWLVEQGISLVGIDYLSIQPMHESDEVHLTLLRNEVVILEGLDLSAVSAGWYELLCLPLPLVGVEAAPARALVRPQPVSP